MMLDEAISRACSTVGVIPPKGRIAPRKWVAADTAGKNGKGDGRIIYDDDRVTCVNWQTGDKATVWLKEERTVEDKRRYAQQRRKQDAEDRERAEQTAAVAGKIIASSVPGSHPYLVRKGFPEERALVAGAVDVRGIGGAYLVPDGEVAALVVPARIGGRLTSVQLIWADGTKKFLYGGDMGGAVHRLARGRDTWLCEGYATGLSLRLALEGLNRRDTVLVCFSAANIAKVAAAVRGRCFIAADNDPPPQAKPDQFGGLGAGEYFARKGGVPYLMPEATGMDINDLHQQAGIFAVQRLITGLVRGVPP